MLYNILHAQQGLGQYPIIDRNIYENWPYLRKRLQTASTQSRCFVMEINYKKKKKMWTLASTFKVFWITSLHLCCHHPNRNPCTSFLSIREHSSSIPALQPRFLQSRLYKPAKGICYFYYFTPLPETLQWCPMALGMKHKSITSGLCGRCIPSSQHLLLFLTHGSPFIPPNTTSSSWFRVFDLAAPPFQGDYHQSLGLNLTTIISRKDFPYPFYLDTLSVSHTLRKNKNDF